MKKAEVIEIIKKRFGTSDEDLKDLEVIMNALEGLERADFLEQELANMKIENEKALKDLRSFMFENVYRNPVAKGEESKAKDMLSRMFEYYITHPEALPDDFHPQLSFEGLERTVCDYIAGMTDNYAVDKYTELFIPSGWQVRG